MLPKYMVGGLVLSNHIIFTPYVLLYVQYNIIPVPYIFAGQNDPQISSGPKLDQLVPLCCFQVIFEPVRHDTGMVQTLGRICLSGVSRTPPHGTPSQSTTIPASTIVCTCIGNSR